MKPLTRLILLSICMYVLAGCGRNQNAEERDLLHGLLLQENYKQLDKSLDDANLRHEKGELTSNEWVQRFLSLASVDNKFANRFDRWVDTTGSGYAHLARGMHLQQQAWKARGSQAAINTTQTQFQAMRDIALLARPDLQAANLAIPRCALCAGELINNNRAVGDRSSDRQLLETALKEDPAMWWPVLAYYQGVYPNWDSYAPVTAFISEMRGRLKDPDLIAYLESRMYRDMARQVLLGSGLDKVRRAIVYYEKGITAKPYELLMKELGEIYANQGHYAQTAELLEKYVDLDSELDLDMLTALSDACINAGQTRKGLKIRARRDELQERYRNLYAG